VTTTVRLAPVSRAIVTATALAAACLVLAATPITDKPHPLCLLRATTGIPCPLCGGTTAAVDLGRFDLGAALVANPFAVLVGGLLALAPLGLARRWRDLPYRARSLVIGAVLIGSELWQLHRVGLLG
jgi:hypothetical protein